MAVDELHYYADLFGRYFISGPDCTLYIDAPLAMLHKSSAGSGGSVRRLEVSTLICNSGSPRKCVQTRSGRRVRILQRDDCKTGTTYETPLQHRSMYLLQSHTKLSLIPQDVEEITEDGAPSGIKDYIVWDPPCVDEQAPKLGKNSSISEATGLMRFLMKRGIRVILFCKVYLVVSHI